VPCGTCEGEGTTHKLKVLYRECEPRVSVEHTTYGVPEKFVKDANGTHVKTESGPTNANRPKHEIETRNVDVVSVEYTYEDQPLIGDGGTEKSFDVYYVEGEFEQNDYPKNQARKILPIVAAVVLILLAIITYAVLI
jgi:hypothetical protein